MIIVEGPDGAGKTHLIRRLEQDLDLTVEPRVVSQKAEAMVDLVDWVEKDLASWPRPALYDRHRLISEPIYGPVLRAHSGLIEPGFRDVHWLSTQLMRMKLMNPTVIFCLPPCSTVIENVYAGEADNAVVENNIDTIYWLYKMEAARWPQGYIWDYTDSMSETTYKQMLGSLRRKLHIVRNGGTL